MLSDRDLLRLLEQTPLVEPFDPDNCKGATIDLHLGSRVRQYSSSEPIVLGGQVEGSLYREVDLNDCPFDLNPGQSILIETKEYLRIPDQYSGRLYERYSVKALGLSVSAAHYLNPGWSGRAALLAVNHAPVPITLTAGVAICQLALFSLSSEPVHPYGQQDGKYLGEESVSVSKLHLDDNIQAYLKAQGIKKVSRREVQQLGKFLLDGIDQSAQRLVERAKREGLLPGLEDPDPKS